MKREALIINNNLVSGGVEKTLQSLVKELSARGCRVTLYSSRGTAAEAAENYPDAVCLRPYPFWYVEAKRFRPKWFWSRFCRVFFERFWLRRKKWDVLTAFKEGEDMLLASALRAGRKTAFVQTDFGHFHWTEYCFRSHEAERQCMVGFDGVAVVSRAAGRGLCAAIGDPGNLSVVYNPINHALVEEKAGLQSPVRPEGKTLLVAVGRLSAVKRFDMLIDICNELSADYPLELWIVGGGELEEELRQKLIREKIGCVRLWGQQDNPYPFISCADWLISASETESYGLSLQEALVLGVPVISCACPAIEENVSDEWGILCGMEKEELKAAVEGALKDADINGRLRENIARGFDKESLWQQRLDKMCAFILGEQ